MSKPTTVVWGAADSGLTENGEVIKDFFGLDRILENFDGAKGTVGDNPTPVSVNETGDLCITTSNLIVNGFALVSVDAVKQLLGDNFVSP